MEIKVVTVVGANGTMGTNVAGIFASFGATKVYMVSRDIEKSKKAMQHAVKSVRAESILENMIAADYSMLEQCVKESDLVFESVVENIQVKEEITSRIGKVLPPDVILCSGTSGLSITKLAECLPVNVRKNYIGIHMFNPPYNMVLCELISTKYTDKTMVQDIKSYLTKKLLRTVVEVKDSPAFLANRIGFQFINEAMQYAEKYQYNGGIDYIDSILGTFTGRSMAPLVTANFVGLDVHKAIVDNLYENTCDYAHDSFCLPEFINELIENGKLGKKSGEGLYKVEHYENGYKKFLVYDISTRTYREKITYAFPFAKKMNEDLRQGDYEAAMEGLVSNHAVEAELCLRFLLSYILYSLHTAETVGDDISSADDVMATGFNWCPPMAMAMALAKVADLRKLFQERFSHENVNDEMIDRLLEKIETSKYDYRLYFKSEKQI